jgi:IMP dehydrogenase
MTSSTVGGTKTVRRGYGFDEVTIVPGGITRDPDSVEVSFQLGQLTFEIPILAAAMDGVVDVNFAIAMSKLGGLAVLNLDGIQTRYENPAEILNEIAESPTEEINVVMQKIYTAPIKDSLVWLRIQEIKNAGAVCAVSTSPVRCTRNAEIAKEAGADVFFVQGTVLTARHQSKTGKAISFSELCSTIGMPVVVGNCVDYATALELMQTGIAGLLVGVGPGAACTSRAVLGIGVPQITATADCAAARDTYFEKTGNRCAIITDGGMRIGGDVCKALVAGADAVMIGSMFAATIEASGKGFHWGMATSDVNLPRGTRIRTPIKGPLTEVLLGPAHVDDGSMNLVGAIRTSMGVCGAATISEFQQVPLMIAPSIITEGKMAQREQRVGMGS